MQESLQHLLQKLSKFNNFVAEMCENRHFLKNRDFTFWMRFFVSHMKLRSKVQCNDSIKLQSHAFWSYFSKFNEFWIFMILDEFSFFFQFWASKKLKFCFPLNCFKNTQNVQRRLGNVSEPSLDKLIANWVSRSFFLNIQCTL